MPEIPRLTFHEALALKQIAGEGSYERKSADLVSAVGALGVRGLVTIGTHGRARGSRTHAGIPANVTITGAGRNALRAYQEAERADFDRRKARYAELTRSRTHEQGGTP